MLFSCFTFAQGPEVYFQKLMEKKRTPSERKQLREEVFQQHLSRAHSKKEKALQKSIENKNKKNKNSLNQKKTPKTVSPPVNKKESTPILSPESVPAEIEFDSKKASPPSPSEIQF